MTAPVITMISVDPDGNEPIYPTIPPEQTGTASDHAGTTTGIISSDGHFVLFRSLAQNLVSIDTPDGDLDDSIFVRDLQTGQTTLVSVDENGEPFARGALLDSISSDGHFALFTTFIPDNPAIEQSSGQFEVYRFNVLTGQTTLVSADEEGNPAITADPFSPDADGFIITDDGKDAIFNSNGQNLGALDSDDTRLFLKDVDDGGVTWLSNFPMSRFLIPYFQFTPDLHYAALFSTDNLDPNQASGGLFVLDMATGQYTLASTDAGGTPLSAGVAGDTRQWMSDDARFVIFSTDTGDDNQVYRKDLTTGQLTLVFEQSDSGAQAGNFQLSGDGRHVVYDSFTGIFLIDVDTQTTTEVVALSLANYDSGDNLENVSYDGHYVTFANNDLGTNVVPGFPDDHLHELYVADMRPPAITINAVGSSTVIDQTQIAATRVNGFSIGGMTTDVESGNTVHITIDGNDYSTLVQPDGHWATTITGPLDVLLASGSHTISVSVEDNGGTQGLGEETYSVVDKIARTISLDKIAGDNVFDAGERASAEASGFTVSGTSVNVSEGTAVTVSFNGHDYQGTVAADGTWNVAVSAADATVTSGYYDVIANATDSGSPSSASESVRFGTPTFLVEGDSNSHNLLRSDGTAAGTHIVTAGNHPSGGLAINNLYVFAAQDGRELWVSDGTSSGTHVLKDTNTDFNVSSGNDFIYLNAVGVVGDKLFFFASDGTPNEQQLWVTDGTTAGTKELTIGLTQLNPLYAASAGGRFFFVDGSAETGYELWSSDGSVAGTSAVDDINPGSGSAFSLSGFNLRPYDGLDHQVHTDFFGIGSTVFFTADDGTNNYELWKSDGSSAQLVIDLNTTPTGNSSGETSESSFPASFVNDNGTLLFIAADTDGHVYLYKSDGTLGGTSIVGGQDLNPIQLTVVDGQVFFLGGYSTVEGTELFATDAALSTTYLVRDINTVSAGGGRSLSSDPDHLTAFGHQLLFDADDGVHGRELWISDGSFAGTHMVKDINTTAFGNGDAFDSQAGNSHLDEVQPFTVWNGIAFFSARDSDRNDGDGNYSLWRTDGTEAGTYVLTDGAASGAANDGHTLGSIFQAFNDDPEYLYFQSFDLAANTFALFRTDGTTFTEIAATDGAFPPVALFDVPDVSNSAPTNITIGNDTFDPDNDLNFEGFPIGKFTAVDPDPADSDPHALTYALLDDAGGRFELFQSPSDGSWELDIGPQGIDTSHATETITVQVTDSAGNTFQKDFTIHTGNTAADTTPPTVTVSDSDADHKLVAGQTDTITFQFSEEVQGFDNSDVTVTGGSLDTIVQDGGDPTKYTATFTPDATNTLSATIKVNAGGYTDIAANAGGASNTLAITGDTLAPAPTVGLKTDTGTDGDAITSDPTLTGSADKNTIVTIKEGATTLGTPTANSSGVWNFKPVLTDGQHIVTVSDTDAAGNTGTTAEFTFMVDTTKPTVTVSANPQTDLNGQDTSLITFTFSEEVQNFDLSDVTVVGGTLGAIVQDGVDLTKYTATFTPTTVSDTFTGSVKVNANGYSDTSNNLGTASNVLTITGDTKAPATTIKLLHDTGSSTSDNISNDVTLSGTGDKNATVHFTVDGVDSGDMVTASSTGAWTFSKAMADGAHTVVATETDAAGNVGPATITFTADTTAPHITGNVSQNGGPYGPNHPLLVSFDVGEAITVTGAPSLTLSNGEKATYSAADSNLATGHLAFKYTPTAGHDTADLQITTSFATGLIKDLAGNDAAASIAGQINGTDLMAVVDATKPSAVATLTNDDGFSATDKITDDPTIHGTSDPLAAIVVKEGNTVIGTANANGSGFWSVSPSGLADGAHTFSVTATDTAGNVSAASPLAFTLDTHAPTLISAVSSAATVKSGDTITITLNFASTDKVTVDTNAPPVLNLSSTGRATYLSGTGSNVLKFSYTPNGDDATTDLRISGFLSGSINDLAGNALASVVTDIVFGTNGNVTSTLAPAATVSVDGDGNFMAGELVTIHLHFNETVNVGLGPVTAPQLMLSDGGKATYVNGSGTQDLTFTYTVGAHDNASPLKITSVNLNGGTVTGDDGTANFANLTNSSLGVVIDTTAPVLTAKLLHDNGTLATDKLTNDATLTGTGEANATVHFNIDGGTDNGGTVVANASGVWTYTPTLADGQHTIIATETDAAGNAGAATALVVNLDTTAPTITNFARNGAALTNAATVTYDIHFDGAVTGVTTSAFSLATTGLTGAAVSSVTAVANSGNSDYLVTVKTGTGSGSLELDFHGASVKDAAGNAVDAPSIVSGDSIAIDRTAPAVTIALDHDNGKSATDKITNHATVSGSGDADATVTIKEGNTVLGTAPADAAGAWQFVPTGLSQGTHTLTATETDAAGNTGTTSLTFTYDTTSPTITKVAATPATGALPLGGTVKIVLTGNEPLNVTGTPVINLNDGGHATYTSGSGSTALTFTYTVGAGQNTSGLAVTGLDFTSGSIFDTAGNVASTALAQTFTGLKIDTTAPAFQNFTVVGAGADGTIATGETLNVVLHYDEALKFTGGSPKLSLSDGQVLSYNAAGSTLANGDLSFQTVVTAGAGHNGALSLNGISGFPSSTFTDLAGNPINSGAVSNLGATGVTEDTLAPVAQTAVGSDVDGEPNIAAGKIVTIAVTLDSVVNVAGTPTLKLSDGKIATYASGTGTDTLNFTFIVQSNETTNFTNLKVSSLTLPTGASIKDISGNPVTATTFNNLDTHVQIDGLAPAVTAVSIPVATPKALMTGDTVVITLTVKDMTTGGDQLFFSGDPMVATLQLSNGGVATFVSNTNTSITFTYTVQTESTTDLKVTGFNFDATNKVTDDAGNPVTLSSTLASADLKITTNVFTFKTTGDHAWHTATNWTPNGDPESGSTAIVGTSGQTATISSTNADIASLITAKGAEVDVNGVDLAITRDATNAGKLQLAGQGHAITLGTTGQSFAFNNTGTVSLLAGEGDATLKLLGDTTMSGIGGTLVLHESSDGDAKVVSDGTHDATLTNGTATVAHTIQGSGTIGDSHLFLINAAKGVITANDAANSLLIDATNVTNTGLMQATNAGIYFSTNAIFNTGGTIQAVGTGTTAASVTIAGGSVSGGMIVANGTNAEIDVSGGTFTGVTFKTTGTNAAVDFQFTNAATTLNGVPNTGTMNLLASGPNGAHVTLASDFNNTATGVVNLAANSALIIGTDLTVSGGGKISMNDASSTIASDGTHDARLTNGTATVAHTISGSGTIGDGHLLLTNAAKGVITANDAANSLFIDATNVTNAGIMQATNAGMFIETNGITNTGGTIQAVGTGTTAASVTISGGSVSDGTFFANGTNAEIDVSGGTFTGVTFKTTGTNAAVNFQFTGAATTLNGVTNTGTMTLQDHAIVTVAGAAFMNKGIVNINDSLSTTLAIAGDGTNLKLMGAGTVNLNGVGLAQIESSSGAVTFENFDNTIQGTGRIGGDANLHFVNDTAGKVIATDATHALSITAGEGPMTNAGLMESTNTGGLAINGDLGNSGIIEALGAGTTAAKVVLGTGTITNAAATTTILASGTNAHVDLDGETIINGKLSAAAGAVINAVGAASTLQNLSVSGNVHVGTQLNIRGTIANTGTITVGTSLTAAEIFVAVGGATFSGAGSVVLADNSGNEILGHALVNNGNTISGAGTIGDATMFLFNSAGVIKADSATNALVIDASAAAMSNSATLEATNAGGLDIKTDVYNATKASLIEALGVNAKVTIEGTITNSFDGTAVGTIMASGAGAHVDLISGATIVGGKLTGGTGAFFSVAFGDSTLDGSTAGGAVANSATINISDGNVLTLKGSITNTGAINFASSGDDTLLEVHGTVNLSGAGQVTLTDPSHDMIVSDGNAATLNNSSTINGVGSIGDSHLTFVNTSGGIVNGNNATGSLTIATLAVTNNAGGIIEGTKAGGLLLEAVTSNQGTIEANAGKLVISGGSITQTGAGNLLSTGAGAELDLSSTTVTGGALNVAVSARAAIGTGVTLSATTTVNNNGGEIDFNGSGETVNGAVNNNTGSMEVMGSTSATFAGLVTNKATIDVVGTSTMWSTGSLNNSGTLHMGSGGSLQVRGASFTNSKTVTIDANSGVSLNGMIINSGTFTVGDNAAISISDNQGSTTVNNTGTISFAGTGSNTHLYVNNTVNLTGGGTIKFADADHQGILAGTPAVLTNGNATSGNTISGAFDFNGGNLTFDNTAKGVVSADYTAHALNIHDFGFNFHNEGTIQAKGWLEIANTAVDQSVGTTGVIKTTVAGAHIDFNMSSVIAGKLMAVAGSTVNFDNNVTLDGVTATDAGTFAVSHSLFLNDSASLSVSSGGHLKLALGLIDSGSGGTVSIAAGGFLDIVDDDNTAATTSQSTIDISITNAGTFDVDSAALVMNGNVTNTGAIVLKSGGILEAGGDITGGTINIDATSSLDAIVDITIGSKVTNAGVIAVTGHQLTITGAVTNTGIGEFVLGFGQLELSGAGAINGGTVDFGSGANALILDKSASFHGTISGFDGASHSTFSDMLAFGDSTIDSGWFPTAIGQDATNGNPDGTGSTAKTHFIQNALALGGGGDPVGSGLMNSEVLGGDFGITLKPADSVGGGNNYAISGALNHENNGGQSVNTPSGTATDPGNGSDGNLNSNILLPSTVAQIQNYLAANGGDADGDALYLIGSGGNDVTYATSNIADGPAGHVNSLRQAYLIDQATALAVEIEQLQADGAQTILVHGLPGDDPTANGGLGNFANFYDTKLFAQLDSDGVDYVRSDLSSLYNAILAHPTNFGFTAGTVAKGTPDTTATASAFIDLEMAIKTGWGQWGAPTGQMPQDTTNFDTTFGATGNYAYLRAPNAEYTSLYSDDQHFSTQGQQFEANFDLALLFAAGDVAMDSLDLKDIGYAIGTTTANYTGTDTGGTLTVTDAAHHTTTLSFAGDYRDYDFITVSDGHGGTDVITTNVSGADDVINSTGLDGVANVTAGMLGAEVVWTVGANVTLSSGVTLTSAETIVSKGSAVTLTNNAAIDGGGAIGDSFMTFVNSATGTISADDDHNGMLIQAKTFTNAGMIEAIHGGWLDVTSVAGGNAQVGTGGLLEFGNASSAHVTFLDNDGTLKLDVGATTATKFSGTISGFVQGNDIDLADINFTTGNGQLSFDNAAHKLTITDGTHSEALTFTDATLTLASFSAVTDATHHVDLLHV